jgi:mRNA interferase MazF
MRKPFVICNRGDIVLVPFPFMELPASKRRPAMIVSSRSFNDENSHSIMTMITTAKGSSWPSDYRIQWPTEAGLTVNCYIRWKTFTLPNLMIVRKLGSLTIDDMAEFETQSRLVFGS